jgi:hypothetical protein
LNFAGRPGNGVLKYAHTAKPSHDFRMKPFLELELKNIAPLSLPDNSTIIITKLLQASRGWSLRLNLDNISFPWVL